MWGRLGKLNKLKDLAVDMVAPRHHDDDGEEENDEQQDTSNYQRQSQKQRPPSHAGDDEGGDDATMDLRQQIKTLQARVEAVEEEKLTVIMQAQQYSSEVKKNYEETVAFYERKVASAQEEWMKDTRVQLDAQRRELNTEMMSLRETCSALTSDRQEAHQQEERLRAQLAALTNEQNTTRHVPATPSVANDEVSSAVISALEEKVKALQHQLDNQLSTHQQFIEQAQRVESEKQQAVTDAAENVERLNAALQLNAQQHANEVKQLRHQISSLESTLQEANSRHNDALRMHAETVATLQQRLLELQKTPAQQDFSSKLIMLKPATEQGPSHVEADAPQQPQATKPPEVEPKSEPAVQPAFTVTNSDYKIRVVGGPIPKAARLCIDVNKTSTTFADMMVLVRREAAKLDPSVTVGDDFELVELDVSDGNPKPQQVLRPTETAASSKMETPCMMLKVKAPSNVSPSVSRAASALSAIDRSATPMAEPIVVAPRTPPSTRAVVSPVIAATVTVANPDYKAHQQRQSLETASVVAAAAHNEPVLFASPVEDQLRADLERLRLEHCQQIQQNMTQMQKESSELVALRKKLPETELHVSELQTKNSELQRQRDAAHRNGEMLKTQMAAHQSSHASACAALQAQLNTLSAELEASRVKLRDAEAAAAAASTSLQVSHEAQQSLQPTAAAQDRIRVLEKSIAERDQQHQQDMQGFQNKVEDLRAQLSQKQAELDASARRLEGERTKQSYGEQTVTNLRSTIDALQEECDRLRSQRKQSHVDVCRIVAHVTPFLSSSGAASSPASSSLQSASTFQPEVMSIEDIIAAVTRELTVQHEAVVEATRVHRQWEQTYQQAKDVNQKVSKQLTDAQKQLQDVRTELSTRDRTIASLQAKMKDDQGKWQDAQVNLSAQHTNTQRFETERAELRQEIQSAVDAKERAQQSIAMVNGELEALRTTLQDREEELTTCQRSLSNLQMVLEQFQRSKQREVEEQTLYLQHELDTLRSQFAAAETLKQKHREDLDAASRTHRKEIASKNVAISGLQAKLTEMKRILEETASQLSDEHMIDKRVVSHLVVNFVHSVALDRGDADDMLKVMSGLLNWDDLTQQRAGLLPGPLNPKRGGNRSLVGGLVRSVWGGMRPAAPHKTIGGGGGVTTGSDGQPRSIAELWVDFLIKEGGATPGDEDAANSSALDDSRASLP